MSQDHSLTGHFRLLSELVFLLQKALMQCQMSNLISYSSSHLLSHQRRPAVLSALSFPHSAFPHWKCFLVSNLGWFLCLEQPVFIQLGPLFRKSLHTKEKAICLSAPRPLTIEAIRRYNRLSSLVLLSSHFISQSAAEGKATLDLSLFPDNY